MTTRRSILVLCLLLGACNDGTPLAAYRDPIDAAASVLPLGLFGVYPCSTTTMIRGTEVDVGKPLDQCYKMQPQRRFRGIWLDQFEGSMFFEGATNPQVIRRRIRAELNDPRAAGEWLGFAKEDASTAPPNKARLVLIEFMGRRTKYPGRYGHLGMFRTEVLVDRMISARPVYNSAHAYIECEFEKSSVSCQ